MASGPCGWAENSVFGCADFADGAARRGGAPRARVTLTLEVLQKVSGRRTRRRTVTDIPGGAGRAGIRVNLKTPVHREAPRTQRRRKKRGEASGAGVEGSAGERRHAACRFCRSPGQGVPVRVGTEADHAAENHWQPASPVENPDGKRGKAHPPRPIFTSAPWQGRHFPAVRTRLARSRDSWSSGGLQHKIEGSREAAYPL